MRTIVVDDEPWMLKRFTLESEGIQEIELLGSFKRPLKALEFVRENPVELAFLDVEMPEMNGLELAARLREIVPELVVIFISAYERYMAEAFESKTADGFIMKPYSHDDLEAAIDRARLLSGRLRKKVAVRTFGTFELLVKNEPVAFPDAETKELLALLIHRRGAVLPNEEACRALWPQEPTDERTAIRLRQAFKRLQDALHAARLSGITDRCDQGAFVHTDIMDCDLFQYMDGDLNTMRQFNGEYMTGYAWAEEERGRLAAQNQLLGRYSEAQTRNTLCASIRCLSDEPLTMTYMNEGFLAVTGYTREEIDQRFHNSLRAMILREDFDRAVAQGREPARKGAPIEVEYRLRSKKREEIWVLEKSAQPIKTDDGLFETACLLIDISGVKAEQGDMERAAQRSGADQAIPVGAGADADGCADPDGCGSLQGRQRRLRAFLRGHRAQRYCRHPDPLLPGQRHPLPMGRRQGDDLPQGHRQRGYGAGQIASGTGRAGRAPSRQDGNGGIDVQLRRRAHPRRWR